MLLLVSRTGSFMLHPVTLATMSGVTDAALAVAFDLEVPLAVWPAARLSFRMGLEVLE